MTLTALRRVVLVGNFLAFGLAGWTAWAAFGPSRPELEARDWTKRFPTRPSGPELENKGPGPWQEEFKPVLEWKQGDKPVPPPPPDTTPKAPVIPPFKTKYSLVTVFIGPDLLSSTAQILKAGKDTISLWVRQPIPGDVEWSLDNVFLDGIRMEATFVNGKTGERHKLESGGLGSSGSLVNPTGGGGGGSDSKDDGFPKGIDTARPDVPRPVPIRADPVRGVYEWELPPGETDWWGANMDDEVKKIATRNATEAEGGGVILKAVPQSSRLAEFGMKAEDRVISVNDEKVTSTDQAVSVGKRQYEAGTSTFVVKVDRAGKIMNFTFRAKKKSE